MISRLLTSHRPLLYNRDPMNPVLSVKDLRKTYPGNPPKHAVDGISFDLKPGEILGFLGPNGSGKTTTIQMLLGTLSSSGGSIVYFGKDFKQNRSEVLEHISFASTYTSLPWVLTVQENLEVFGRFYGLSPKESKARYLPLLERFGLKSYLRSRISSLSAGQITRLMVIKAFFIKPKVVLLDEPTASLDPDVSGEICSFILEQRDTFKTSVLFTSHKMEEVSLLCDRVIFLKGGKIIANDLPKNLMKKVSSFKLKLTITDGMKRIISLAHAKNLKYEVDHRLISLTLDEEVIPVFLSEIATSQVTYSHIQIEEPSLEDFFLHIAKGGSA